MSRVRVAAVVLLASLSGSGWASGSTPEPPAPSAPADPVLGAARKSIERKDWPEAVRLLEQVQAQKGPSADVSNLLGYAERQQGHLDAAFAHYETALRLDPKHRGAHEYVGEAYLLVGNLAKAEEHLKALDKLCLLSCEEYRDLKRAVAAYRRDHPGASP